MWNIRDKPQLLFHRLSKANKYNQLIKVLPKLDKIKLHIIVDEPTKK